MKLLRTEIDGVLIVECERIQDYRGFFSETWNRRNFAELGLDCDFVQDNQSVSREVGTLRGLHYQLPNQAQSKLVRCGRGRLYDVAVDIRKGSPTFRKWIGVELSSDNGRQLFIPEGFLHGFITREPDTEILYKCSSYYSSVADRAIRFDDSSIGIDWGVAIGSPVVSKKDADAPRLSEVGTPFTFKGGMG